MPQVESVREIDREKVSKMWHNTNKHFLFPHQNQKQSIVRSLFLRIHLLLRLLLLNHFWSILLEKCFRISTARIFLVSIANCQPNAEKLSKTEDQRDQTGNVKRVVYCVGQFIPARIAIADRSGFVGATKFDVDWMTTLVLTAALGTNRVFGLLLGEGDVFKTATFKLILHGSFRRQTRLGPRVLEYNFLILRIQSQAGTSDAELN